LREGTGAFPFEKDWNLGRLLSPLRLRLLGLVAVASFPAALLIARLAADERANTFQMATDVESRLLDSALAEQQQQLGNARQLIQALSRLPEVASGDPATCSRTMSVLLAAFPTYLDAERITPSLRRDCGTHFDGDMVSDLAYDTALARAVRTNGAANGYYGRRRDGVARTTIVQPIHDAGGRVAFYLAVDMGVEWISRLAARLATGPGTSVTLTRADGLVLARAPDPEGLAGRRRPPNETFDHMMRQHNGFVEGLGFDGRPKLYAFHELQSANSSPILLALGVPKEAVYAEAHRILQNNLLVAAVTLVLALMMAWLAADLLVIRDVKALLGATRRIASGDLSARVPAHGGGGELHNLAGTFNDMAQRLEERRREFLALGDASPDAIARIDCDMRIDWANEALIRRLGTSLDALVGKRITDVPAETAATALVVQHVTDVLKSGERREVEMHASIGARDVWLDLRFVPERDNTGDVTHVMLIARDVTARKHLETHLAQAERLDSIGKLAGSISHDFNNLLTAIIGNTEIAIRSLEPDHRVRADLSEILDVARRASALTRQLLSFARRQVTTPRVIDVKPFITEASTLLRRLLGENVTLKLELDPKAPRIRFDPTHLEQVLANLATNGRDAMPRGGMLTIATSRVVISGSEPHTPNGPAPGEYLLLRVTDTGVGMSPAVRERIFEPFFTTKHERDGTGLGLAVTYGVVRQHGGFIEVQSAEGAGTTFRIYFPATAATPDFVPVEPSSRPTPTGRETILLVEDQEPVRSSIARLLRSHGYTVAEARDGVDALGQFSSGELPSFSLVITDLVMPRMGGEILVRELRGEVRDIPVLLISGFDERGSARGMLDRGEASALLEKPFEAEPLLRLVRELLDRSAMPASA
jgi:PAS domain S-box-containing protein